MQKQIAMAGQQRLVRINLRTLFEDGSSLQNQDWYGDKLTISHGTIAYADEDWYEGNVRVGSERITIVITGTDIPKDFDGRPGHHVKIVVYELDGDDNQLNFYAAEVQLVNNSFSFQYETGNLN